jgi:hypothetical protein
MEQGIARASDMTTEGPEESLSTEEIIGEVY